MKYLFSMFAVVVLMAFSAVSAETYEEKLCANCDLSKCPPAGACPAGTVRDECGCCEVCGLEEGQLCDYTPTKEGRYWHGYCGFNLDCRKRLDIDTTKMVTQSVCECEIKGLVCGSDGITYSHCQIAVAEIKSNVTKKHDEPCQTRPKIISYSESQSVSQGTKHTLLCEVQGFPIPSVQWSFAPPGSENSIPLPGDSEEVSISVRGGPEKMRITTYLQITDFQLKHEGTYECVASAIDGMASQKMALVYQHKPKNS